MVGATAISDLAIVLLVNETDRLFITSPLASAGRDPTQTATPTDETQIHSSRGVT